MKYSLIISIFIISIISLCSAGIPELLLKCYSPEEYPTYSEMPPLNLQLFVELLRKIEFKELMAHNIRVLTSMLYHRIELDGIQAANIAGSPEFIIPFSDTGYSNAKYKLLQRLIPGDHEFSNDTLSTYDLCLLHKILSTALDIRVRRDESTACPIRKTIDAIDSLQTSSCPIAKGVIYTKYGTISPGHLIQGIGAEYTKSVEKLSKFIPESQFENITNATMEKYLDTNTNNVWMSTILTDLAEVLLYQQNKISIANDAKWNDTLYPHLFYLTEYDWELSSAELLGGIDGLILASQIKTWTDQLSRTRLSQIIDMYYSRRGVSFDKEYTACNRQSKSSEIFKNIELEEQVISAAILLKGVATYSSITEEGIKEYAKLVVNAYEPKRDEIIAQYDKCKESSDEPATKLLITVIMDGSLNHYESQRLISYLTEEMDVSYYGSKLGIINGQSGNWIVNVSDSLSDIFSNLTAYNDPWPTYLSLSQSLYSARSFYENDIKSGNFTKNPFGHCVIVLMNKQLSTTELQMTNPAINNIKSVFPELRMVYVIPENTIDNLYLKRYDNDIIIETSVTNPVISSVAIANKIKSIPRHLIVNTNNNFEDYITPGLETLYEVNKKYIKRGDIKIKFTNNEYGNINICIYSRLTTNKIYCKDLSINHELELNAREHCHNVDDCTILLKVTSNSAANKCSEPDCRYPDQVRINIHSTWATRSGSSTVLHTLLLFIVNLVFTFVMK